MPDPVDGIKTTYVLEMASRASFAPSYARDDDLEIVPVEVRCPEFNAFLHRAVGADHRWSGRLDWTRQDWVRYLERPGLETWVGYWRGCPAGYFELELTEGSVCVHNFGLLREFRGRGLGGQLLTSALERAWALRPSRVWLSTCSHDHPHAIANYVARGFRVVSERADPANEPVDPWPYGRR